MKLIKQQKLYFQEGKSNKTYEVDLCDLGGDEYVVNFRYGRIGSNLKEGTKTVVPVSLGKAESVFDSLVESKTKKGYVASFSESAEAVPETIVEEDKPNQRAAKVVDYLEKISKGEELNWSLSRILWQVGNYKIKEAESLVKSIKPNTEIETYTSIWARIRLGDQSVLKEINNLNNNTSSNEVLRAAAFIKLNKNDVSQIDYFKTKVPNLVRNSELNENLYSNLKELNINDFTFVFHLYVLSFADNSRENILKFIQELPLKAGNFKGLRRIFKLAELIEDYETLGIVSHKLETSSTGFTKSDWGDYGSYIDENGYWQYIQNVTTEITKPDTKIAYSQKTKAYFARRIWRDFRIVHEVSEKGFVLFAKSYLTSFTPENEKAEEVYVYYDWDNDRYVRTTYKRNRAFLAFNYLLYSNSRRFENRNGKWLKTEITDENPREEFAQKIWDKFPLVLLEILADSKVEEVAFFAMRALKAQSNFGDLFNQETLIKLLTNPLDSVVAFAIQIIKKVLEKNPENEEFIKALFASNHPDAFDIIKSSFERTPKLWKNEAVFNQQLFFNNAEFSTWRAAINPDLFDKNLANSAFNHFINETISENVKAQQVLAFVIEWIESMPKNFIQSTDEIINQLLAKEHKETRLFGASLLNHTNRNIAVISEETLELLSSSKQVDELFLILKLLKAADANQQLRYNKFIARCMSHPQEAIRKEALSLFENLKHNKEFCDKIVPKLAGILRRQESAEGVHNQVFDLLTTDLKSYLNGIESRKVFAFINANYLKAQELGYQLLNERFRPKDLNFKQLNYCANAEYVALREYTWNFYKREIYTVKQNMKEALKLLDSNWEDSRNFAFDYFENEFTEHDWNADLLISIVDNVRDDVQVFGRQMISKFFKEEYGPEFLLKLSEHPNGNVQLMATNYLRKYATDKADKILELELFYTTVLMHVNKSKVAKNRILNFLRQEALKSKEVAQMLIRILEKTTESISYTTASNSVILIQELTQTFPELKSKLKPIEYETRA